MRLKEERGADKGAYLEIKKKKKKNGEINVKKKKEPMEGGGEGGWERKHGGNLWGGVERVN